MSTSFTNVFGTWEGMPFITGSVMTGFVGGFADGTALGEIATVGPFDLPVEAEDGAKGTVHFDKVSVMGDVPTKLQVLIDAPAGSTLVLGGHTWTVSADRKRITTIA